MLRTTAPGRGRHPGFTLVELLVVIAIIGILAALTTAAVQRVRERGKDLQMVNDLKQMDAVIGGTFKRTYNVAPISYGSGPSGTFRLCSTYVDASGNVIAGFEPEVTYLRRLFGRINLADNGLRKPDYTQSPIVPTQVVPANPPAVPVSPNLATAGIPPTAPILLDPNQCLVFFLTGGSFTGYQGFSTDPTQPFRAPNTSGEARKDGGAYLQIETKRLVKPAQYVNSKIGAAVGNSALWTGGTSNNSHGRFATDTADSMQEPWYVDTWGHPFLYLAPTTDNSYPRDAFYQNSSLPATMVNPLFNPTTGTGTPGTLQLPVLIGPWGGDYSFYATGNTTFWTAETAAGRPGASAATQGPRPYRESAGVAGKYVYPTTWQVTSFGKDGQMARGGLWKSIATGGNRNDYADNKPGGGDDFANFTEKKLGAAVQD